ncbi:MAG: hypothetical protein COA79_13105 [Planctomycetota bacterium]|nr:MAG: hypothetical protein COA79_13105 [Planctomycetota bacterium]
MFSFLTIKKLGILISFVFCLNPSFCFAEDFVLKANENCHVGNVGKEVNFNAGNKATRGKLKGPEEFVLVNFDLSKIKNKTVTKAKLRIYNANAILNKIGFSSIATKWTAGERNNFEMNDGAGATWLSPTSGKSWAWKGNSTLAHVINELGGSRSCFGTVKKIGNYYEFDVNPEIIEVVASGHHKGFAISEHDGWRRQPWVNKILYKTPDSIHNPWIYLKEQNGKAPTLFITVKGKDTQAPGVLSAKAIWKDNLVVGEVLLEIIATGNDGSSGKALFYEILADGRKVPAWMLSAPVESGKKQLLRISDCEPGKEISFSIRAVDGGGNRGPEFKLKAKSIAKLKLPEVRVRYTHGNGKPSGNKAIQVWAYPDLQKANPVTGNLLASNTYFLKKTGGYRNGNNVWDGKTHTVKLAAIKDEWIAFQIGIENISKSALKDIEIKWSGSRKIKTNLYREWYIKYENSVYPDALVPLEDLEYKISIPDYQNGIKNQTVQSIYIDMLIDKDCPAGIQQAKISITVPGQKSVVINVEVDVANINMPRKVSTIIEFNHYSFWEKNFNKARSGSDEFIKVNNRITAMAHQNRCTFNGVPYTQYGTLKRPVPVVEGEGKNAKIVSWEAFDKTYEGIFSGSIFKNNHRSEQAISHQTLPFFELWPANMFKPGMFEHDIKKNPSFDPLFSEKYRNQVLAIGSDFINHFKEKGWNKVQLQLFLNNKANFKKDLIQGNYWLFDEPRYHNGYETLAYLGSLYRDAFKNRGEIDVVFRADISRPQYQETLFDSNLDLMVAGGFPEHEHILRRNGDRYNGAPFRKGEQILWSYGGVSDIGKKNVSYPNARIMDFLKGADGHLPWLIAFMKSGWKEQKLHNSNDTATILYNTQSKYSQARKDRIVIPSIRLKAYRRAQQDTDMLLMALKKNNLTRNQFRQAIASFASYEGKTVRLYAEDAGTVEVKVDTENLEGTREVIRSLLGGKKPFNMIQKRPEIDMSVGTIENVTSDPKESMAK